MKLIFWKSNRYIKILCKSVINDFVLKKGVRTDIKRDLDNLFKYEKLSMIDIDFASFTMIEKLSDNRESKR